ncbi:MAG: hypothetical protein NVS4B10_22580 [Myxococcales bacterium]
MGRTAVPPIRVQRGPAVYAPGSHGARPLDMEGNMATYFFVVLKYRVPLARIEESTPSHRAFLKELHGRGKLIASGPFVPREGGGFLMRVADAAELSGLLAQDPFHKEGLVETTIYNWAVGIGLEGLDSLPRPAHG